MATTGTNGGCSDTQANPIPTVAAALACAGDGDTVSIATGTYAGGITVAHSVTLQGAEPSQTTISGGRPVVAVNHGVTATIEDLTISGGNNTGDPAHGGGIDNLGTLTVTNSALSGNSSSNAGGGIFNEAGGTLTVTASTISGNTVGNEGGGIYNYVGGTVTLSNNQGPVELGGNQIAGRVSLTDNTGGGSAAAGGAPEVEGNSIGGSLSCGGTAPLLPMTVRPTASPAPAPASAPGYDRVPRLPGRVVPCLANPSLGGRPSMAVRPPNEAGEYLGLV